MKYIKLFEERLESGTLTSLTPDSSHKYKSGDYVFVQDEEKTGFDPLSKIVFLNGKGESRTWDYQVDAFNYDKNKISRSYVSESLILRKLTPEEIEEYEAKVNASKYNL